MALTIDELSWIGLAFVFVGIFCTLFWIRFND